MRSAGLTHGTQNETMEHTDKNFYRTHAIANIFAALLFGFIMAPHTVDAATRPSRATVSRSNVATRAQPVAATPQSIDTDKQELAPVQLEKTIESKPIISVTNKMNIFDDFMSDLGDDASYTEDTELAKRIREQREAIRAQDITTSNTNTLNLQQIVNNNKCDTGLRACMQQKCGADFTKCSGDSETVWGNKMDTCRRDLPCTGEEYKLFSIEIKADRDANADLSLYNSILDCGNRYNDCIVTQCGTNFTKCLGKSSGDRAIDKCKTIAKECTETDSGLASRTMSVFGSLRSDAEKNVARDEKRLYELRDLMRQTCQNLGASFDDRTLDCVYTIKFRAGEDNAVQASKKAYAGTTFSCTPDWFGIDITTYMENAFRLTREQTSATSAIMGSGIGLGVGAITSGAIGRSIDTAKAERDLNQKLCEDDLGTWNKTLHTCKCPAGQKFVKESGCEDKKTTTRGAQNATPSTGSEGQPPAGPTHTDPTEGVNKTFTTPTTEEIVAQYKPNDYDFSKSALENATNNVVNTPQLTNTTTGPKPMAEKLNLKTNFLQQ